jgi:hypothetical protein
MKRALALLLTLGIALNASAQGLAPGPRNAEEEDAAPELAFAAASDPNPGSGRGQIIAGWIATGVGVAGVAQASLCKFNEVDRGSELRRCRNLGIVFGAIGLTLGIPWLVFGYHKRRAQRAWKQRHGLTALPELELTGDSLLLNVRF